MLKLFCVEDPADGVFPLEFVGACHIDADIKLISTEGSPDSSSTLAEGDGRTPVFSHHEMGPAKRAMDHLNRVDSFVGGLTRFPWRTFHSHKVMPQGGDEAVVEGLVDARPTM
jgi:hypothetical protein